MMGFNFGQPVFWIRLLITTFLMASSVCRAEVYRCNSKDASPVYQATDCGDGSAPIDLHQPQPKQRPRSDGFLVNEQPHKDGSNDYSVYLSVARVNNIEVKTIIDTGASFVSVPLDVALKAGLKCTTNISINTAAGIISVCKTKIDRLALSGQNFHDVDAVIVPKLDTTLIGMNILGQMNLSYKPGNGMVIN